MEVTHIVHGIPFHREGECDRCGECGCKDCPHYAVVDDLPTCLIYDQLGEICEECTEAHGRTDKDLKPVDHSVCSRFPNHPWLRVVREGLCGYTFTRLDDNGEPSDELLPFMDKWQSQ